MIKPKNALVLGASGLVGQALISQLVNDNRYGTVTCLLRRPLSRYQQTDHKGKLEPIVIDFERMEEYQGYFAQRHIYVCLGTTIKQAKTKQAFRKVDFEYIHVAAQLARAQQACSFVWISSIGANAGSRNFYLRVKGELENAILSMPRLQCAAAVRPSFLLGDRQESRRAEKVASSLGQIVAPLMIGRLSKYRPIHADDVAAQMIDLQVFG